MSAPAARPSPRFWQSPLAMAVADLAGTLEHVNDALAGLLDRPAAELLGTTLPGLAVTEAEAADLDRLLAETAAGEAVGSVLTVELRRGDGGTVHGQVVPSRVHDGDVAYLTVVVVDVSARVQAEQALRAGEARWQALLAHAADVTWTGDAACTIRSVTSALPERLGWQPDDVVGRCGYDFVHTDDLDAVREAYEQVVAGAPPQRVVECRLFHARHGWTWVRETLTNLLDDPHVSAVVGNIVDLTAEREQEQQRARQEARLRARFEQSSVPQAVLGTDGRLVEANGALGALLGRAPEELRGVAASRLAHPTDHSGEQVIRRVLSGRLDAAQMERVLSGADGRPVPALVDLTLLRRPDGSPAEAAVMVYDLTRLHDSEQRRQRQLDFFLALSQRSSNASLVSDVEGRLVYASPGAGHVFGYEPAQLVGVLAWDFVHPDDRDVARAVHRSVINDGEARSTTLRVLDSAGRWRTVEVSAANLLDTAVGGLVVNLRDVTERVEAEHALRVSEARFRAIVDTAQEGIWTTDLDGRTLYVNQRMADLLGVPLAALHECPGSGALADDQLAQVRARLIAGIGPGSAADDLAYRHPDGGERRFSVVSSALPGPGGDVEGSLAMVSDVTDARRAEQELRRAALHDSLTGLPNRALLLDRLEHALARESVGTAVLFLDLDQFKLVNDSRGHAAGDELLVAVAERLRASVRPGDTAARFGGDEFVVVCEDVDEGQAMELAEELLLALGEPFRFGPRTLHVSASIGVAVSPPATAGDLLRYADTAMYDAKASGRRRARLFDRALSEEAERRYLVARELRSALAAGELEMHYQPVVDLQTGGVLGIEALARWDSPSLGQVAPSHFVPVAELTGASGELDAFAVGRALSEAAGLRASGALSPTAYVAVNLSARSLADAPFEATVVDAVESAGLDPAQVVLEITESAIVDDAQQASGMLRRFRDRGFQVAVDDFGTGYSSLAYLRTLPITSLKIDRSFVAGIETDVDALAIVASVVDLARAVGVTVVAEGVETAEQAALLRRLGCPAAQGWLWSRAQPAARVRGAGWSRGFGSGSPLPAAVPRVRRAPAALAPEHGRDRLLELHHQGASLTTIAAALNADGFRTPEGVRWHRTSVARAVASAAYPQLVDPPATSRREQPTRR